MRSHLFKANCAFWDEMAEQDEFPPLGTGIFRLAVRLGIILAVALTIYWALEWISDNALASGHEGLMLGMIVGLLLAYAILIAIPFMPGIEIGISLLFLKGAEIAPFVYLATVVGLMIAFVAGRYTPYAWLHSLLADLRLKSACDLVDRLAPLSRRERLSILTQRVPSWVRPLILPGRYVLIAALLNVPGNALFGGGGGISFIAGFSRLYNVWLTVLVIALAVLPVPLTVWLAGTDALADVFPR